MPRVNYDQIAHLYDEPLRDHVVDPHLVAFVEQGRARTPVRVLDVGCGTGKQLTADRHHFPGAVLVGVDRFAGMLRIARRRCPTVTWVHANGTALPIATGTIDYVTNQFSYPHIRNTRGLLAEIFRVLVAGGRFVMTNIDPWAMPGWLVYRYFPDSLELDRQDFLPVEAFVRLMTSEGFTEIAVSRRDASHEQDLREFLKFASQRHRASQMMAITDAAYERGLQHLARDVRERSQADLLVRSEFVFVTISGDKP